MSSNTKAKQTASKLLQEGKIQKGPVVYWMSRDQRVNDNRALLFAQEMALEQKKPLVVIFCLVPRFLEASLRQYAFMLKGLGEVEQDLTVKQIPFVLLIGEPAAEVPKFVKKYRAAALISDFDPLRIKQEWKSKVMEMIAVPFYEIDAHNIVPHWIASPKPEYGAYTLRPKIHRLLPEFLHELRKVRKHPIPWQKSIGKVDWQKALKHLRINRKIQEVSWIKPGEKAARKMLRAFIKQKLTSYPEERNDPTLDGQSNLSPYLHFGQLSGLRVALEVRASSASREAKESFLEELIVRRELSDNFCFHNANYDNINGFPEWARKTLSAHAKDRRDYLYSYDQFESAGTHDDLWNAAQREMVQRGKMHGYMRMYWAKKILEWTESPEQALEIAIRLNDTYELDGRDPNGYTGIAWSIGGVHDRAWKERPVFGKIRYMNRKGCERKFNVRVYIDKYVTHDF